MEEENKKKKKEKRITRTENEFQCVMKIVGKSTSDLYDSVKDTYR